MLEIMQRRVIRILLLFWLGWYLTGPMAEMVDFWDTPTQEMRDVARSAGGMVALIGTAIAIVFNQIRKLRERLRQTARLLRGLLVFRAGHMLTAFLRFRSVQPPSLSPPILLRI